MCTILADFPQESVLQEIGTLIYGLDISGAELICHAVCILLPSMATCLSLKPALPPLPWSQCNVSVLLLRPPSWPN